MRENLRFITSGVGTLLSATQIESVIGLIMTCIGAILTIWALVDKIVEKFKENKKFTQEDIKEITDTVTNVTEKVADSISKVKDKNKKEEEK